MQKKKALIATSVIIVFALLMSVAYILWEPSGLTKDSFIYRMKIPSVISQVGEFEPAEPAKYLIRNADGLKNTIIVTEYTSLADMLTITSQLEEHGLTCDAAWGGINGMKCTGMIENYVITALLTSNNNQVLVYLAYEEVN